MSMGKSDPAQHLGSLLLPFLLPLLDCVHLLLLFLIRVGLVLPKTSFL